MEDRRPPERFHVFVSYTTREDEVRIAKPMVDRFLSDFLRPAIEQALGEPFVFYDGYMLRNPEREGFSEVDLERALRFAIEESEVLVAFVSPEYPGSHWCRFECATMASKQRRPWFDVCRVASIPELKDRRLPENRPGRWACARARLMRWLARDRSPRPGGVIVPVIWKGDARLVGEMSEFAGLKSFDWTPCAHAPDMVYHAGVYQERWAGETPRLSEECSASMRATAREIARILRQRHAEYAAG